LGGGGLKLQRYFPQNGEKKPIPVSGNMAMSGLPGGMLVPFTIN